MYDYIAIMLKLSTLEATYSNLNLDVLILSRSSVVFFFFLYTHMLIVTIVTDCIFF